MSGIITLFATNFAPSGYVKCNGQLLSVAEYPQLFEVLKTQYGGDGVSTFGLPNMAAIPTDTKVPDTSQEPTIRYITSSSGQVSLFAGTFVPQQYTSSTVPDIMLASSNKTPKPTDSEVAWFIQL